MASEYLAITVGAILVNNFVLSKFLGICPFLGVSKSLKTALGMSGAVVFVMTLASLVTAVIYNCLLAVPIEINGVSVDLSFLKTLIFIVVIASLVQLVEIVLQKLSPSLYQALGIFLPLITTNCAVLGVAILSVQNDYNLLEGVVFAAATAVGFGLSLIIFSSIREHLDLMNIPKAMKGVPIAFIVAGLLAMAFMGFAGIV